MRQTAAFLILLSFLAQMFSKTIIVADYYVNTTAFAKNCVNKDRPAMHCNGKCQMMKKIKQEEQKDQQNQNKKSTYTIEVISCRSFFGDVQIEAFPFKILYLLPTTPPLIDRSSDIFHPPPGSSHLYIG